jgi:putative ABC transport system permease protein
MIPIAYNLRNLRVRRSTTAAAALGLGLVVLVFALVMMIANGLRAAMQRAADPDVAIVLRKGASVEMMSWIDEANIGMIAAGPGVAHTAKGQVASVVELVVLLLLDNVRGELSHVTVRGVPDDVMAFRPTVTMLEGRAAQPGTDEVIVGKAIRSGFKGLGLGETFELRKNRPMKVVGVFEDHGSAFESEIWGDRSVIQSAFGRDGIVSSVRVRLESPDDFDRFKASIEANRQLNVSTMRDSEFYAKASRGTALLVSVTGFLIAILFSIGAVIGAMITMHEAVAQRQREIGTLRALGFSRRQVLASFFVESIALALIGGIIGIAASLLMSLKRMTMMNFATGSDLSFKFESTPQILVTALVIASVMGILGGLFPAVRAARMNPIQAMRGEG